MKGSAKPILPMMTATANTTSSIYENRKRNANGDQHSQLNIPLKQFLAMKFVEKKKPAVLNAPVSKLRLGIALKTSNVSRKNIHEERSANRPVTFYFVVQNP